MTGKSPLATKFAVHLAGLLALGLLAAAVAGLSAARDADAPPPKAPDKPARPPEDEDPNAKTPTHKVNVDEPDEVKAAPRAVDLKQAARDAKNFAVRNLFHDLAVPHDFLKFNESNHSKQIDIQPIPYYVGDNTDAIPNDLQVTPIPTGSPKDDAPIKPNKGAVAFITPYEELAEKAVDKFLGEDYTQSNDPAMVLSRYDQLVAAEQALTSVLLHLKSDRQTSARKGDEWQKVENDLQQKLLGVLLAQLDALVKAARWDDAFALTQRLAATYHSPKDQERIAGPLAGLVQQTLAQSGDAKQKAEARKRLRQLLDLFPDNPAVRPVGDALQKQADELFEAAKKETDKDRRDALLKEAGETWPGLPELQAYLIKIRTEHPVLRVGVRELPKWMSPGLAASDSDLRAVELLFESLMKLRSDAGGVDRWTPALAAGPPVLIPRGRQFLLPPNAYWSNGNRMTARDVADTVQLMQTAGKLPQRPPVWGDMLDKMEDVGNPYSVKLTLRQGWLDPLALMNFKVEPSGTDPDSPELARRPVGSGPYVFAPEPNTDGNRPCVSFTANPYYGARPGKNGRPRIEQIRFVVYKGDPAAELKNKPNRLDLILDLTAKEAAALAAKQAALGITLTGPASPNRRIYFLAVNNRKTLLDNAAFRCTLAYAIHRDKLLDDDFRAAPGQALHTPLNGPYPVHSWATNPKWVKERLDPFDAALAKTKKNLAGVQTAAFTLKYPAGDPQVDKAMKDLCDQVKEVLAVTLTPTPLAADELRDDVEKKHNYDLAYYHYDFPDDVYWLGPLLDPAGENYLGYTGGEKDSLVPLVQDGNRQRDFPAVRDAAYQIHDAFLNEEMPFIPLWQLDPLAAVHSDVQLPPGALFDPVLVFPDVEEWNLKP